MNYRGFQITRTSSGGKAGYGCNKTASVRVTGYLPSGKPICKYVRYSMDTIDDDIRAEGTAATMVDKLLGPVSKQ